MANSHDLKTGKREGSSKSKEKKSKKKSDSGRTKSSQPKPSYLSEERVVDSGSDEETAAPVPTKKNVVSDRGGQKNHTKTSKSPEKASTKVNGTKRKSDKSDSNEEDEDESGKTQTRIVSKKPETIPAKINGMKRKADESESESSEEDEGERESKKAKTASEHARGRIDAPESSTPSSSEEEDSANSDSGEPKVQERTTPTPSSTIHSIPAPPFDPPPGYASHDIANPPDNSPFSSNNLIGKQFWHITAPSNVPLRNITEIALDAAKSGKPVLTHKGVDYIMANDKSYTTQFDSVLLPRVAGYQLATLEIQETLHIQPKIEMPTFRKKQVDMNTGSNAAADVSRATVSTIRPQPEGLKMRYKPPGFGRGEPVMLDAESDMEDTEKTKGFQFPQALGASGEAAPAAKNKAARKKRRDSDVEMEDADAPAVNGRSRTQGKEVKIKNELTSSQPTVDGESAEDKARRREAKRLKKEAKRRLLESGN